MAYTNNVIAGIDSMRTSLSRVQNAYRGYLLAESPDRPESRFADIRPEPVPERGVLRAVDECRTDGSTFPLKALESDIPDRSERLFIGLPPDITERRHAEERLQHQIRATCTSMREYGKRLDTPSRASG